MPTSQSLKAVSSRPSETRSASNRPSATRRIFDTMENLFFREGEELSQLVPGEDDQDEITELVPRRTSRRKLAILIAGTAVALVTLAALIL